MSEHASTLTALLGLAPGARVAVTGCGGKTSLVAQLARENRRLKVLVTPTTKMYPMAPEDALNITALAEVQAHRPVPGVQCLGLPVSTGGAKLGPLPQDVLRRLLPGYDLALLEADGSAGLPCKGWRQDEPVVPDFCSHTVGVISIRALGLPATEAHVLRLPLFLSLTGLAAGDAITMEALVAMAGGQNGLFRHSAGTRVLFINQADDETDRGHALALAALFQQQYPAADRYVCLGSLRQGWWEAAPTP